MTKMIQGKKIGAAGLLLLVSTFALGAAKITSIDFKGTSDPSQIEIKADGPITFQKTENAQDNQIVIELNGAQISKAAARKIDASSFKSKVSLISAYQVKDQPDTVRVVIQLREAGTADVAQDGNNLRVSVAGGPVAEATDSGNKAAANDENQADSKVAGTPTEATKLDEFMVNKTSRQFNGKPITLQVREVEAADVFRLIGEASGFNIILGDDVKGKITLSMTDVPWDQALDVILHTMRLGVERNNNILRIVTLASLTAEKQQELQALKAAEATAPRVTRVFPISYANLTELQTTLTQFASSSGAGGTGSTGAVVQLDSRTNSLIVRDLPDNLDRMKKLIELLDTQTPQVLIEAKIIEATEGFSKTMTGSLGIGGLSNQYAMGFGGGNPVDALIGTPGVFADGAGFGKNSSGGGTMGLSPTLSFIPGISRLNAILNLGEGESQLKVISSPKIVVLNKEKSTIVQATPVLIPGTSFVAGVGTVPTTSIQNANLSLAVKPVVTNDGGVLMDLTVSRDIPFTLAGGNTAVANRNMNTTVLVDSGTTLVIGGIYTMTTNKSSSGFPFLRKIPILGVLFGSESESTDRSELFIFITPKILNPKEAGLSS